MRKKKLNSIFSFLYVPCPFSTWAIMTLHNFLSLLTHSSVSQTYRLSTRSPFTQAPQTLLPPLCTLRVNLFKRSLPIMCPITSNCLFQNSVYKCYFCCHFLEDFQSNLYLWNKVLRNRTCSS